MYGCLSVVILLLVSFSVSVLSVLFSCCGFEMLMIGVVMLCFCVIYVSVICVCGMLCVVVIVVMVLMIVLLVLIVVLYSCWLILFFCCCFDDLF